MKKIKSFILTALLGGLTVVLPIAILSGLGNWIFLKATGIIQPLTNVILKNSQMKEILADIIICIVLALVCFLIGLFERTSLGKIVFTTLENKALKKIPMYSLIKETIIQFTGNNKSPFSKVALVDLFGNGTLVTAFVTDETDNGKYVTIFMPTGPNPTSGNIYHVLKERVREVDYPVEATMKSIISCGVGSKGLFG